MVVPRFYHRITSYNVCYTKLLREKLSVSYGGLHMGDMLFDVHELPQAKTIQAINRSGNA